MQAPTPCRPARRLKRAIMPSTSTTLRIPLAAVLRHPGNARPVVAAAQLDGLSGLAPRSRPDRRSRSTCSSSACPRASWCAARSPPRGTRPAAAASSPSPARSPCTSTSCSRCNRSRARPTSSTTTRSTSSRWCATRCCSSCRLRRCAPPILRGPVPDLRRQPQPGAVRLRHQRDRPPLGGPPVARAVI